jgi:hypothetical protein
MSWTRDYTDLPDAENVALEDLKFCLGERCYNYILTCAEGGASAKTIVLVLDLVVGTSGYSVTVFCK